MKSGELYRLLLIPIGVVLLMWVVFWIELTFDLKLNNLGVYPRTFRGLMGIICSPFVHGDLAHLAGNTFPILLLLPAFLYFYPVRSLFILAMIYIATGLITWLIGRPSYHIGMSGIIYAVAFYLIFKGFFIRRFNTTALAFAVIFMYGGLVWYVLPIDRFISWEGHLAGLGTGLAVALLTKKNERIHTPIVLKPHTENQDEFLKHFDAEGNFIENLPQEESDPGAVEGFHRE